MQKLRAVHAQTDIARGGRGRHKVRNRRYKQDPAISLKSNEKIDHIKAREPMTGVTKGEGACVLSSVHEVFVNSLPKDISPLVGEVEHVMLLLLPPVLPPVLLYMPVVLLTKNILPLSGNDTHPIFVDPHIIFHAMVMIDLVNLVIDPVQLLSLVGVALRLWTIVWIPSQLRGI